MEQNCCVEAVQNCILYSACIPMACLASYQQTGVDVNGVYLAVIGWYFGLESVCCGKDKCLCCILTEYLSLGRRLEAAG